MLQSHTAVICGRSFQLTCRAWHRAVYRGNAPALFDWQLERNAAEMTVVSKIVFVIDTVRIKVVSDVAPSLGMDGTRPS